MSEQLELEMSKSWCTAGCSQLLTPEEFKNHECYSRSRPVEKLPSVVFSSAEIKQAEDAALERERLRMLNDEGARRLLAAGTVGEKVAEVLEGSAPSVSPKRIQTPKEETYREDTDFDLYQNLDPGLVKMFKNRIRGIRVECPEHKSSKWNHFVADTGIVVPTKFAFLPPASKPENEKYNLSGWVEIHFKGMTDEDYQLLNTIKTKSGAPYIEERMKRLGSVGHFADVKLALTLLATDPKTFLITSEHHRDRERGPRKSKEITVVA